MPPVLFYARCRPSCLNLAALAAVLGALLLAAVSCKSTKPSPSAPTPPVRVRVITWNIHHGEGLDRRLDLQRIASLIRAQNADVVALQEVDQGVARTQRRDLPAELAALTGLTFVFDSNYDFGGGRYGNAILSRFPVLSWTNHLYRMLSDVEPRGLLCAVIDIHGAPIAVANTHLDAQNADAERLNEVERLPSFLEPFARYPLILCGDFNALPGSTVHRMLAQRYADAWERGGEGAGGTVPVQRPTRRIDYLWLGGDAAWEVESIQVLSSDASDHLPVVATLQNKGR